MAHDLSIKSEYTMLSGHKIPALGYGVYQTPADVAEEVVLHSFKVGYRHVDSARVYRNEGPCAEAIKKSGIPRSDIFFTSKVPPRAMGYEATKSSITSSFSQTRLDYIDLYLIHAPYGGKEARRGTWLALLEAQQAGRIRSIGVSNYGVHHLDELESYIQELEAQHGKGKGGEISVGQWELHPWLARPDIVEWCRERGVVIQAYCPIVRGQRFEEPVLKGLGEKYGKTAAQVLLRWSLQKGFVPLPKSVTPSRIEENAEIFDFRLTDEEMKLLETGEYAPCSWDPTTSND
ncbi:MAG: hypothetical protein LQ339_002633 [Xanthoria mediterranea]|nr:MAG: hypothetical protein LQ339_002633 [Xanthoria mediterranea]